MHSASLRFRHHRRGLAGDELEGALFVLNRGYTGLSGTAHGYASIDELAPQKKVVSDKGPGGDPMDCIGGVYFTMAGLYYAAPDGTVTKQDAKDGTPRLATNGAGGDGSCFDGDGRFYITAANGVQVFDKDGKHLGTIPASRNLVSKVWIESIPLLASGPKGRGK